MITFKTKPEAVWISADNELFDPSELSGHSKEERSSISFLVYPFTPALGRELRSKHVKKKTFDGLEESIDFEESKAFQEDLIDHLILDWKGLLDEDNEPIECTKENKIKIFDYGYPLLGACLIRIARVVMSRFDEIKEKESKNSLTSQGGSNEETGT